MENSKLTLIPSGGLANRMRAIASAYNLCTATGARLQVVWFRDHGLNCRFGDIFEPYSDHVMSLREAQLGDYLLLDRPRRRNLRIPHIFQQLLFDDCIYEKTITPRKQAGFDFEAWLKGRRCYMSCYQEFGAFPPSLYRRLFKPIRQVKDIIDGHTSHFSDHTIGLHIRRTDNTESRRRSPDELFIETVRREQKAHPCLRVFLATDSEEVKQRMKTLFGDIVMTPCTSADRDSAEGIMHAVAEMWTLASTRKIYGSAGSSYSTMAASVGGTPIEILSV